MQLTLLEGDREGATMSVITKMCTCSWVREHERVFMWVKLDPCSHFPVCACIVQDSIIWLNITPFFFTPFILHTHYLVDHTHIGYCFFTSSVKPHILKKRFTRENSWICSDHHLMHPSMHFMRPCIHPPICTCWKNVGCKVH